MTRQDWPSTFMQIAETIAVNRSTCAHIPVGCVITISNRIISIGYNGVPSGHTHCCDIWENTQPNFHEQHSIWSMKHEIHAEMNAILFAAKNGISLEGAELYTTYSPCVNCAKNIQATGIKALYYKNLYKNGDGIEMLNLRGIPCVRIE